MSRRDSREVAVKIMYQREFQAKTAEQFVNEYFEFAEDFKSEDVDNIDELEKDYILDVVSGTIAHRDEFWELITATAKDWKPERIAKVDVAVLLVALYEVLYKDDVPTNVAINEAVEIAKRYGRDESGKFVNGILGAIYRAKTGETAAETEAPSAEDETGDKN